MIGTVWHADFRAMQGVVVPAVLKLLSNPATDFEMEAWRNCDVSKIEKSVNVASKQQSISWIMLAACRIWADMCRFKHR